MLGPGALHRPSVRTEAQAAAAPLALLDYVGIGGVYGTTSKASGKSPIGLDGLRQVIQVLRDRIGNFPTCGIAGITAANAEPVIAAGADGVSVISALSHHARPGRRRPRAARGGRCGAEEIRPQSAGGRGARPWQRAGRRPAVTRPAP